LVIKTPLAAIEQIRSGQRHVVPGLLPQLSQGPVDYFAKSAGEFLSLVVGGTVAA